MIDLSIFEEMKSVRDEEILAKINLPISYSLTLFIP